MAQVVCAAWPREWVLTRPTSADVATIRHGVENVALEAGWRRPDLSVVVSELVANAIRAAGIKGFVVVTLRLDDAHLELTVSDSNIAEPFPQNVQRPADDSPSGRGLYMVACLTDWWYVLDGSQRIYGHKVKSVQAGFDRAA
jgi:anti-sigma regulatory factor (Ser/Thr protein kinase)